MVSHHCSSLQILTANMAGKSPSDHHRRWFSAGILSQPCRLHGGSAGGDSWVSSPVTLALICAPVFWRRSVFCCGEDWNWISGIAGSISGISSRIWCWIFMDFMLKIGISMDFMQDLYHWNLDFTMKLWCLKTHGTPWDRSWHDLSRSEVRLPGLHGGKVRRADLSSGRSGLFSDPSHPSQLKSVGECWWEISGYNIYISLYGYYINDMSDMSQAWFFLPSVFPCFSHKIPLDPITAQSIPMNFPLIIPSDPINPDFCYDIV